MTGASPDKPRSLNKDNIHMISQQAVGMALYSASVEDLAVTDCFVAFQEIGEFPNNMQKPDVDFLESIQLPQSESL